MNGAWQTFVSTIFEDDSFAADLFGSAFLATVAFATFAFTVDVTPIAT